MNELETFFNSGRDELLTFNEARAVVKRSRTEFWRIRKRKKLRVHRIGRKGFLLKSELIKCFDGE
jgi:hypothetical protein